MKRLPRLCVHPGSKQYYIRIARHPIYLGACDGTPEAETLAEAERLRVLNEFQKTGALPGKRDAGSTINVLLTAYLTQKVAVHYRKADGTPTKEQDCIKMAIKPLQRLYGHTRIEDFGPLSLETVQQSMIDGSWMTAKDRKEAGERFRGGWCRKVINRHVNRLKRLFSWGVSRQIVPVAVHQALLTVEPLLEHRSAARETTDVPPASWETIEALLAIAGVWKGHDAPWLSRNVADMMRLQLLSGARPGELCALRANAIDRTGESLTRLLGITVRTGGVWAYLPGLEDLGGALRQQHKTAHHGKRRIIPLGPQAQKLLAPYMIGKRDDEPIFSPVLSRAERYAAMRAARKTSVQPSQLSRRKEGAKRQPGDQWTNEGYGHAIAAAIRRLNDWRAAQDPPLPALLHFHPHQLRKNAATELERQFGIEVARIVCGHSSVHTTEQFYVQKDLEKAFRAIEQVG